MPVSLSILIEIIPWLTTFGQEGMSVIGTGVFDDSLDLERLSWIQDHVLSEIHGNMQISRMHFLVMFL